MQKIQDTLELDPATHEWLDESLREISSTINPRSWVEDRALKSGREIVFEGGLGNPLRGFHPVAAYVRDAASRVQKGNFYGREGGLAQTIVAAQLFFHEADNLNLSPEQILVNEMGSCQLLGFLAEAMADKNAGYVNQDRDLHVLVAAPAYGRHISVLPLRDVRYHLVDFWKYADEGTTFAQALEAEMKRLKPKLVVLSSVYNPTTRVMTDAEVEAAVEITQAYGAVLLMDDAYRHVYRESRGPIRSVLSIPAAQKGKVCATWSSSKGHQSPGQGGLLIGHPEVVEMARKVRKNKGEGGFVPNQLAMAAMLRDIQYLRDTRAAYDQYFDRLVQTWRLAGWDTLEVSEASIFIEAKVPAALREAGWNADSFVELMAQNGVILYPSSFFMGHTRQRVRICANGTFDNIDRAAEIIQKLTSDPPAVDGTWPLL